MYAAKHYVRAGGKLYTAGEILPEDLPREKTDWLLRKGAIELIPGTEPAPVVIEQPAEEPAPIEDETPADPAEETPESEIDEDAEPEEIDAAEGIVSAPTPKTADKPATRRKGGRK